MNPVEQGGLTEQTKQVKQAKQAKQVEQAEHMESEREVRKTYEARGDIFPEEMLDELRERSIMDALRNIASMSDTKVDRNGHQDSGQLSFSQFVTEQALLESLGINRAFLRVLMYKRGMPFIRLGRKLFFYEPSVASWLLRQQSSQTD